MDFAGNGNLIEKKDLNKALDLKADTFTFDIFRYICIISGCDYLPNLPGIGLGKASKLFRLTRQTSIDIVSQIILCLSSLAKINDSLSLLPALV